MAITQLVVEILCLVILIRATIRRDLVTVSGDREFFGLAVTATLLAGIRGRGDPRLRRVPRVRGSP